MMLTIKYIYRNGIENISVVFSKPEKRSGWEEAFNEAKQKLCKLSIIFWNGIYFFYFIKLIKIFYLFPLIVVYCFLEC